MDNHLRPAVVVHEVKQCFTIQLIETGPTTMIHHWDFFGPDAAKTAEHFRKHLFEFVSQNRFTIANQGFFNADINHTCFWVEIISSEESLETQKRLRPRRSLSENDHQKLLADVIAAQNNEQLP
jgi:hypothetical protein